MKHHDEKANVMHSPLRTSRLQLGEKGKEKPEDHQRAPNPIPHSIPFKLAAIILGYFHIAMTRIRG